MTDPLTANWNVVEAGVLQLGPILKTLLSTEAGSGPGAPFILSQVHARKCKHHQATGSPMLSVMLPNYLHTCAHGSICAVAYRTVSSYWPIFIGVVYLDLAHCMAFLFSTHTGIASIQNACKMVVRISDAQQNAMQQGAPMQQAVATQRIAMQQGAPMQQAVAAQRNAMQQGAPMQQAVATQRIAMQQAVATQRIAVQQVGDCSVAYFKNIYSKTFLLSQAILRIKISSFSPMHLHFNS